MKPLETLHNSEKARLIADLLPNEINLFLDHLKAFCIEFRERKEEFASNWTTAMVPFDYWQHLSAETEALLNRHMNSMKRSSKVYADQLYFSQTSLFVNDRIIKYAEKKSQDEKFKTAIKLFYNC
ncbi:hypothetical protein OQX63_04105 [Pedobacter sp. PF22-3]|uniref:hypothetical protein n=1 Tax=Pedobacter sp. PF22-3 TaxID=2994467 RepID=UPI00224773CC|nr:hypothetical protein [Pedobacter sp. PF22-3]MCX2492641.1 hypothetical protein [Pedobacter sp. PF22-3]